VTTSGRRATLADVARQAGVSTTLVSLVMRGVPGASPANREKVFRVARELGYVPDSRARALRGRSHLLGVMYEVHQPFHADLVDGIYAAAEEAGYDVVLSAVTQRRNEDTAVETLLADRCEALLLCAPQTGRDWITGVAARLPTVVLARHVRHPDVSVVRTADVKGIGLAVNHLTDLGHTQIAHIDGGRVPAAEQRRRGYRAAMTKHGLTPVLVHGGWSEESGFRAAQQILGEGDRPTAIVAFNDACATGALSALFRAGVAVPQAMSVVGFDDTHLAGFSHVGLTTIRQDATLMAQLAVSRAISRIEAGSGDSQSGDGVVPPTLVIRGTTGPARA
jgi:DNA-binding LacI/PurR family transcriptional regulator